MNISSENSSIHASNFSGDFFSGTGFEVSSVMYIICILMSLPINSYVIWLILTGTGNGLAAEFFNLNLSVCEIIQCVEALVIVLAFTFQTSWIVVFLLDGLVIPGRPLFECLLCVERYLAVVHPVIFLKYKPLRYRLMCSAVVWMVSFASGGYNVFVCLVSFGLNDFVWLVPFFLFLFIQLFCCVAVLRVLKQSGPGERGREREEENHMKKRAFHLILITTVTTFIMHAIYFILYFLPTAENVFVTNVCIGQFCFFLTGLVQPVFFLYRVGKMNLITCQ